MNTTPPAPFQSTNSANGEPSENEPATATSSIHHKASKYALVALIGSFFINILATRSELRGTDNGYLISLVAGVFFLSAFPAGIIALCGIKKHGPRKLLWRGLIGVLLPVIGISIGVAAFQGARSAAAKVKAKADAAEASAPKTGGASTASTENEAIKK